MDSKLLQPRWLHMFALTSALAAQTTITVTDAGDDPGTPRAGSLRWAVIAANQARGSVSSPITITFAPGLIGQRISLYGQLPFLTSSSTTLQVATASASQRVRIALGSTTFVASGVDTTIRNLSFEGGLADSVSLFGCWRTTFENCDFLDTGEVAVFGVGAWGTTFKGCTFDGAPSFRGMGILATDGSDHLRIEGSTFRNFPRASGLTCTGVFGLVVTGSTFSTSSGGIHLLEACQHAVIGPNVSFDANYGGGLVASLATDLRIADCTFRSNGGSGIYLQDRCDNAVVERCTFDRNGIGSAQTAAGASQIVVRDTSGAVLRQTTATGGGGAGLEALNVVGLTVESTAPASRFAGNQGIGIVLKQQSRSATIDSAVVQGNGAGVVLIDSFATTLLGCSILDSAGCALQTIRCSSITVTRGTLISGNGQGALAIGDSTDVVIGPRNPLDPVETGCKISGTAAGIVFDRSRGCRLQGNTALASGECVISGSNQPLSVTGGSRDIAIGPGVTFASPAAVVVTGGAQDTAITGCTFSGYSSNALFVSGAGGTQVRSCTMTGKPSTGAGIILDRADDASLFFNVVSGNGGQGLVIQDSARVLVGPGNVFKQNSREGILVQRGGSGLLTSATLQSTQVTNNGRAGSYAGVACRDATVGLVNCTIAGSHNWGLYVWSTATVSVANSILWGASFADRYTDRASTAMSSSIYLRQGGAGSWTGTSNLSSDPLLANVAADDVHLRGASPAKESGNNAPLAVALPSADIDGEARVMFSVVDRGADESAASGVLGNSFDVAGTWIREADDGLLAMTLSAPQRAGGHAIVLASFSGATNGFPLNQGAVLPLQVDALTQAFLAAPAATLLPLDAQGGASFVLAVPREFVAAVAREVAFAFVAVPELDYASNPVVVRFFR